MSLSNLTAVSAWTDKAALTPDAMNLRLSQITNQITQINSDASLGFTRSGSTTSLDPTVGLVFKSIDSGGRVFDIRAWGAVGDAVVDDYAAIQNTIFHAQNAGGGTVWFPKGAYKIASGLTLVDTTSNTIILQGEGQRDVTIRPTASVHTAIMVGTVGQTTSYGKILDLTVTGTDVSNHTGCGLQMISPQYWRVENVNIEEFGGNGGTGLYLTGAVSANAPHAYRCYFNRFLIATTQRPAYMVNADENDFVSCTFGLVTGSASSVTALEIAQGRNNRFLGTTIAGETNLAFRPSYTGIKFTDPALGNNSGHFFDGVVIEGFDYGVVFATANDIGIRLLNYNSSVNSAAWWNGSSEGSAANERGNAIHLELVTSGATFAHRTYPSPWPEPITFSDGSTTPSVHQSDFFAAANTSKTTITNFANPRHGKTIFVRLEPNTDIQHGTIRCSGATHLQGNSTAQDLVGFTYIGGAWQQHGRDAGLFKSRASTYNISAGTLVAPELWATSGISVGSSGNTGSLIPAISSTSSLVAAFVVQGSASSFTIIQWPAAKPYDHIFVTPGTTATVSSLSSGLVAHSHCTQAGQIEFRLSNASTLAQNQSTRTWFFTRISPF